MTKNVILPLIASPSRRSSLAAAETSGKIGARKTNFQEFSLFLSAPVALRSDPPSITTTDGARKLSSSSSTAIA